MQLVAPFARANHCPRSKPRASCLDTMDTLPPLPATLPDMMYLEPAGVVAGPRLNLGGVTVYSGYFSLVANTAFRGVIHAEDRQAFSFFVPTHGDGSPPAASFSVSRRDRLLRDRERSGLVLESL